MSRGNIVVFGANGYLGKKIIDNLNQQTDANYRVHGFTRGDRFIDKRWEKIIDASSVYFMEGPSDQSGVLNMGTDLRLEQHMRLRRCCELAHNVVLVSSAWCNGKYKDDQGGYNSYINHKMDLENIVISYKRSSIIRLASVVFKNEIKVNSIASDIVKSIRSGNSFKPRSSDAMVDIIDGKSTVSFLISEFTKVQNSPTGRRICINSRESITAGEIDQEIRCIDLAIKTTPLHFANSFVNNGDTWEQWHGDSSIDLLRSLI